MGMLKPRKRTLQATAMLRSVFEKQANHMPHQTHILRSREKVVSMVLLATFTWKETIPEVNATNVVFGLKEESASNISKIQKLNFLEYSTKKLGDNFACCGTCDRLQILKRRAYICLQWK